MRDHDGDRFWACVFGACIGVLLAGRRDEISSFVNVVGWGISGLGAIAILLLSLKALFGAIDRALRALGGLMRQAGRLVVAITPLRIRRGLSAGIAMASYGLQTIMTWLFIGAFFVGVGAIGFAFVWQALP